MNHALENKFSIRAPQQRFAGALGMRHDPGHIALLVANTCNVLKRTVGICGLGQVSVRIAVLPQNLVIRFEIRERLFIGKVTAFAVSDRNAENFPGRNLARLPGVRRG